jgi:PIN domain nuclease of toxin-antitoxin system
LSASIVTLLEAPNNDIFVSAASLWEIAIKTRIGKLDPLMALSDIPDYVQNMGFYALGVTAKHAIEELTEAPPTKDPFDRLLLAQCQVENMRLVTVDRSLEAHPLAWRER